MIKLEINEQDVLINKIYYPDGTPKIDLEFKCHKYNMNPFIRLIWKFDNMSELFELMVIKDCLDNKFTGIKPIMVLDMPYIPNARMDRVKSNTEAFTLKTFCKLINQMCFDKIYVDNAHSDVSVALLNNVTDDLRDSLMFAVKNINDKNDLDTIMFPDNGACKRYSELGIFKNCPIIVGNKKRDWKTGVIQGLEIIGDKSDINGKNILIIDDICSRGGTFKYSAIELKKLGAKNIYLYVTHCENVIDIEALKQAEITKVYTTDSIYRGENDFVEVI